MAQSQSAAKQQPIIEVPGILVSASSILWESFGDSIVEMKAKGARKISNSRILDSSYGLSYNGTNMSEFSLNYQRRKELSGNIENPINPTFISTVEDEIRQRSNLYNQGKSLLELSTDKFVLEVENDDIMNLSWANSDRFDLEFVSWKPEKKNLYEETEDAYRNLDLHHQNMNYRNLVLQKIVEAETKYNGEDKNVVGRWGGWDDSTSSMDTSISQRILFDHLKSNLPDGLSVMRRLRWGLGSAQWDVESFRVV